MTEIYMTKMRSNKFMIPVTLEVNEKRVFIDFPYNIVLKDELKLMEGCRYHGYDKPNPRKVWSVKNSVRNWFQMQYLMGQNPYKNYETPLVQMPHTDRPLFDNQKEMVRFALTRKQCMFAAEMGLGKTLAGIEVMEHSKIDDWIWVGSLSALAAARVEFDKWGCKVKPIVMTYDAIRRDVQSENIWIPNGIIFDESAKLKTPTVQRSQAASILVEEMRKKYKNNCFIILMTGAPAPRNPGDWWHQLEVACPGFIREGTLAKFKQRLSITVEKQYVGQERSHLEVDTWLDDKRKCKTCGKLPEEHSDPLVAEHQWEGSVNEVALLDKRMEGLVLKQFKKDCLDLPDKHFYRHKLEPSKETLRSLALIKASATRTVTALIQIRELSDGFQYSEKEMGEATANCERCGGAGKAIDYKIKEEGTKVEEFIISCPKCGGTGKVAKKERKVIEISCPKDKLLEDLLEEYESIGRFVIYAGFQASVDRVCRGALRKKWNVIRVDGRGWQYYPAPGNEYLNSPTTSKEMLQFFQNKKLDSRICFVGQPGAAGMGLTLTASPAIFYWSNTFNAEDRIQSMDRIHRPGMDLEKGAKIIDVIHLPVDEYILDNLDKKMDLQDLSLGKLKEHM
jgi:SNF2 family DNA or RNA helicase